MYDFPIYFWHICEEHGNHLKNTFDFRSQKLLYIDKLTMEVSLELFHAILKIENKCSSNVTPISIP